jgi:hypothetical protein
LQIRLADLLSTRSPSLSGSSVARIVATIIRAVVNPLPAIPAPATIPVLGVVVSERYAKEREVIESIAETPVAETVLKAVAAALIEKTSIDEGMPAGGGCTDKAVSTGDEDAPARKHATIEAAIDATKAAIETAHGHAPAAETTAVESTAAKTTAVEATAAETTAVESAAAKTTAVESAAAKTTAVESAAAETTAVESAAAETTAVESTAAETTAVATAECQGGTARGQRRAQRGRGQQYTEAFHIILLPEHHFGRRSLINNPASYASIEESIRRGIVFPE